jgi:AcrR family transcriptional regulator
MTNQDKTLREKRNEKRKEEILEAAFGFFASKGYDQTSMEEIAEAALLTRAGLYKHYSDKASLLGALRAWKINELQQRLEHSLKDIKSFEEKLHCYIAQILIFQNENQGAFRVLFTASKLTELKSERAFEPIGDFLRQILGEAQKLGKVSTELRVDELAPLIASIFFKNELAQNLLGYKSETTLERDIWLLERLLLKGIQP